MLEYSVILLLLKLEKMRVGGYAKPYTEVIRHEVCRLENNILE